MVIQVFRYTDADALADDVAERLVSFLAARPAARLCLPTGATPAPAYARLAAAVRRGRVSFREAEVFLLDEFGGVPPSAAGRCEQLLRRALLDHVDLPAERFHAPDPEAADIEGMCRAYEEAIDNRLDLTVLGIGTNGHIGMNEPGTPTDSRTRRVALAPETTRAAARYFGADQLPTWGVTLGLATLLASGEIWLLATGEAKADAIRAAVRGWVSADLPASLLQTHDNCLLFADAAAAAGLDDN
jgi:glucosamine-6-phosphate deaminase